MLLTQSEKERLAELLREIEEEEEDGVRGGDSEVGRCDALIGNICCPSFAGSSILPSHISPIC